MLSASLDLISTQWEWRSPTAGATTVAGFFSRLSRSPLAVWAPGTSLMSDMRTTLLASTLYVACVALLRARFPKHEPASFSSSAPFLAFAVAHNVALSAASLWMNVGLTRAIADLWAQGRAWESVCNPRDGSGMFRPFMSWMYLFYLSKFWEFMDTALLVLRGRPLTFLHVWHHASVPFEAFAWLESRMALGVYGMWFNTFVHVLMYSYFAAVLLKIHVPWKQALTSLQIVQFCVSFLSLLPWAYFYATTPGGCTGNIGLFVSATMNAIFLKLFISFYRQTYAPKPASVSMQSKVA